MGNSLETTADTKTVLSRAVLGNEGSDYTVRGSGFESQLHYFCLCNFGQIILPASVYSFVKGR